MNFPSEIDSWIGDFWLLFHASSFTIIESGLRPQQFFGKDLLRLKAANVNINSTSVPTKKAEENFNINCQWYNFKNFIVAVSKANIPRRSFHDRWSAD